MLLSLKEDLEGVNLINQVDRWKWKLQDSGIFSVSSAYKRLVGVVLDEERWTDEEKGFLRSCGSVRLRQRWWLSVGELFSTGYQLKLTSH